MTRRYTTDLCLYFGNDDVQTGEADVTCSFAVQWDESPYGPPQHEVIDIEIHTVDGEPWTAQTARWDWAGLTFADATDTLIWYVESDRAEELIEHAQEVEAAAADDEAEALAALHQGMSA
jgi:hypothetical protein